MFETCIKTLKMREEAFDTLTSCHSKDRIAMWEVMDDQPKLMDSAVVSIYEVCFVNGMQIDDPDS